MEKTRAVARLRYDTGRAENDMPISLAVIRGAFLAIPINRVFVFVALPFEMWAIILVTRSVTLITRPPSFFFAEQRFSPGTKLSSKPGADQQSMNEEVNHILSPIVL